MIPPTEGSGGVGWQFTSQFGLSPDIDDEMDLPEVSSYVAVDHL
jgi:hypothetical protein